MDNNHIGFEIRKKVQQYQDENAIYYKNHKLKTWVGISWTDFGEKIQNLSKALLHFGIKEHQNVAIFAENMADWIVADIAIMSIRAVTVPIYATNSKKEVEYIVNDAEINVIFVGCQEEYDNALEISKTNSYLKLIVMLCEDIKFENTENSIHINNFLVFETDEIIETELQKRYYESESTDLASIIYTSGTTGEQKGVMLDHTNFMESLKAHDFEINVSEKDTSLSFLPLSHIYERSWVFFCLHRGIKVYFNQNPKLIAEVLKEVKSTLMCTVPRIFEKIYAAIQDKKKEASPIKIKLMDWALAVGNTYHNNYKRLEILVPKSLQLKYKIADKLVLSKLREVFGGRIKFMPCGGAPLAADMIAFFHSFGLNIKCGYGLTETTATVSLFGDTHFEFN